MGLRCPSVQRVGFGSNRTGCVFRTKLAINSGVQLATLEQKDALIPDGANILHMNE
jgi:hypothetical protein